MIQTIMKKIVLLLKHCNSTYTPEKELDIRKLKILLNNLSFSPVSIGTLYIIEELEFLFNNNIFEIKKLSEAYNHYLNF